MFSKTLYEYKFTQLKQYEEGPGSAGGFRCEQPEKRYMILQVSGNSRPQ
jgi:hypothetical protein